MRLSCKVHRSGDDILVAIADADIVGKVFTDDKQTVRISSEFYGDPSEEAEILTHLKSATIVNAIGKASVGLLIKNTIIDEKNETKICGLPHAQVVCV